jgi:hypothetical protein
MDVQALTLELSSALAISESELIRKGLLAFIEKEIRLAEWKIAQIRERYDVFSKESLYEAIQNGEIAGDNSPGQGFWRATTVVRADGARGTGMKVASNALAISES